MVIWKEELHRGILYFVRPTFRMLEQVMAGTFKDIINAKRAQGFSMQLTQKYFDVFTRFADEAEHQLKDYADANGNTGVQTGARIAAFAGADVKAEILTVRDLLCAMIDEEIYWTPRWHNMLLRLASEEGLLEPVNEPD